VCTSLTRDRPDFPHNTWWLTQAERDLAVNRMALDTVGNKGETSVWAGFRQAAKDPMVWVSPSPPPQPPPLDMNLTVARYSLPWRTCT
jgi:hypothetical protein